jgi:hypothetical protein
MMDGGVIGIGHCPLKIREKNYKLKKRRRRR